MSHQSNYEEQGTKNEQQVAGNDNEVLVKVDGVSKIFCRDLKKSLLYGLKDSARDLFSWRKNNEQRTKNNERRLRDGEFLAVNNVSFELRRGECLGLIGRNGAGKTTLLKMLNGLIKPDAGRIEIRGRVGALIALGAGFNPILSGRENIYVNGSILGLSKRNIDIKLDEIINFAEIDEFIDTPVQSYSSGMQVRLGFAVAVTLIQPDVLILDEVLAVGDSAFRIKCLTKLAELTKTSATVFVSHDSVQISRACNRVIWMSRGSVAEASLDVDKTLSHYASQSSHQDLGDNSATPFPQHPITDLSINGVPAQYPAKQPVLVNAKKPFEISLALPPLGHHQDVSIKFMILSESGDGVAEIRGADTSCVEPYPKDAAIKGAFVKMRLNSLQLTDGLYDIRMAVGIKNTLQSLLFVECLVRLHVEGNGRTWCRSLFPASWEFHH